MKGLISITTLGILGSLASIISLLSDKQFLSNDNYHIFYLILISLILIISVYLIFTQKDKIDEYESINNKITQHTNKFKSNVFQKRLQTAAFIEASKSFLKANKDFFDTDYDDIMDLIDEGIEYKKKGNYKSNTEHDLYASQLVAKFESHLIKLPKKS